jgi:hypothetical protein
MRAVIDSLLPDGSIWQPAPGGDLDNLLDGMGDNAQVLYDFLNAIASIRDPRKTTILSDLEKEYGVLTNEFLTEQERRDQLVGIKYAKPDTASDDLLQDKLRAAGFDGIIVTSNDPAIDPALITGELLVNGPIVIEQTPQYLAQANGDNTFAGNGIAIAGYFVNIGRTFHEYDLPSEWRYWRYIFFVGGAASGWPGAPAIATLDIDYKREEALKTLILKYKPLHSWCVLVVDFIMIWEAQTAAAPFAGSFFAAAFGDDLYLLVGASGEIETSPDGVAWTKRTAAAAFGGIFSAAAYGNGTYVIAGASGEIQTSPDGINWTHRNAAAAYGGQFLGAAWNGELFVLVGETGEIQTSPDGITWTNRANDGGFVGDFNAITHGNNLFVAAGTSAEIQTSPDGITWTAQTADPPFAGSFQSAVFGDGKYILTGATGEIQRSLDGEIWQNQTPAGAFAGTFSSSVFGNEIFVIMGSSGEIQRSSDGKTWKHEDNAGAFGGSFFASTYGNRLFTIAGSSAEIQTS